MSISFVAKSAFASGTTGLTVAAVSGTQAGDLILLFVESANQAVTTPSGYTTVPNAQVTAGTAAAAGGMLLNVFYKWATGADGSASVADTGDHTTAIKLAYRGVDKINPFDSSPEAVTGTKTTASTSSSYPGITTTTANALVIYASALDLDSASTATTSAQANANLTSLTERHDQTVTSGAGGGIVITDGFKAAAGASGAMTATVTSTQQVYVTIALREIQPIVIATPVGGMAAQVENAYFAGGFNQTANTYRVSSVTLTQTLLASGLSQSYGFHAGMESTYSGYSFAYDVTNSTFDTNKLAFATETFSEINSVLPGATGTALSYASGITAVDTHGYVYSTSDTPLLADKFTFATETGSSTATSMPASRYDYASLASLSAGYLGGGYDGTTYYSSIAKIPFSTEVYATLGATLAATQRNGAGISSVATGYFVAGSNQQRQNYQKLSFASDTMGTAITQSFASTTYRPSSGASLTSVGIFASRGNGVYGLKFAAETVFSATYGMGTSEQQSAMSYRTTRVSSVVAAGPTVFASPNGSASLAGLAPSIVIQTPNYLFDIPPRALSFGGLAPSLGVSYTFAMPVRSLALAGQAPTIAATAHQYPAPGVGALSAVGLLPTSQTTNEQRPLPGVAALSGLAPSLGITYLIGVAARLASFSGQQAVVATTAHQYPSSPVGLITAAGQLPTAAATDNRYPNPAQRSVVTVGAAPAVATSANATPAVASATLSVTGGAPSLAVSDHRTTTPGALSVSASGKQPAVVTAAGALIQVPAAAISVTGRSPEAVTPQGVSASPGVGRVATPAYAGEGYLFGFDQSVRRVAFASEVAVPTSAVLAPAVAYYGGVAVSSGVATYLAGAENPDTFAALDLVQKYVKATDTASTMSQVLSQARDFSGGASTSAYGYVFGGFSPDSTFVSSVIDSINFSTDAISAMSAALATASSCNAVQSAGTAYLGARYDTDFLASLEKFDFLPATMGTVSSSLTQARAYAATVSGQSNGAFIGGYTFDGTNNVSSSVVDVLTFASEAIATAAGELATATDSATGISSNTNGYAFGGFNDGVESTDIVRFNFDAGILSLISGGLTASQTTMAGSAFVPSTLFPSVEIADPTSESVAIGAGDTHLSGHPISIYIGRTVAVSSRFAAFYSGAPTLATVDFSGWERPFADIGSVDIESFAPTPRIGSFDRIGSGKAACKAFAPQISIGAVAKVGAQHLGVQTEVTALRVGASVYPGAASIEVATNGVGALRTRSFWVGVSAGQLGFTGQVGELSFYAPAPEIGYAVYTKDKEGRLVVVPLSGVYLQQADSGVLIASALHGTFVSAIPQGMAITSPEHGVIDG